MTLDRPKNTELLKSGNLVSLFIDELGWDNPSSRNTEEIQEAEHSYSLIPIADKRGVRIYRCNEIPDRPVRQKIEKEITKRVFEHLIIFLDEGNSKQIWQWVARHKGKPAAYREHIWLTDRSPEPLLQKLDHITFSLDDEEALSLSGTTKRLKDAFDRDQITKRFYDEFKKQHDIFLGFIDGITNAADKQWYASLMLNRLMFVYFIQKKGFLDEDINYLKNRLSQVREKQGAGKFHSFYRAFLLKLFHGGFATPLNERDQEISDLIGQIPYLNGGLFEPHFLEGPESEIQIADKAFEDIFSFFDQYDWTLDTREIGRADGKEINPDVLGHIFEKYINQKQMGAYYTKEDITEHISKQTIIPWLFNDISNKSNISIESSSFLQKLLHTDPDRYIYSEVRHGINHDVFSNSPLSSGNELPNDIIGGCSDTSKRNKWNNLANEKYALPTETWRDVCCRRIRYHTLHTHIVDSKVSCIDDFITYNLDIRQFARDAIQYSEDPEFIRAFWSSLQQITVLDPACGSGAFLFAALNILEDLYDACLERMQSFVDEVDRSNDYEKSSKLFDFRETLKQISIHPNREYYIYKTIILNNLFGVDIMEEATEICKLRLFLKLASQLERTDTIEPLPDIDFNIKTGNSLIGYTSFDGVKRDIQRKGIDFEGIEDKIIEQAEFLNAAYMEFRQVQTELDGIITPERKDTLKQNLRSLEEILDRYMAKGYGIDLDQPDKDSLFKFNSWKRSHKPFHWLVEFYGILDKGGFDTIIGNPPYIVYSKTKFEYRLNGYETEKCANLYAYFCEKSYELLSTSGMLGMILPNSSISADKMAPLQNLFTENRNTWISNYSWRPAKLFEGANMLLAIVITKFSADKQMCNTSMYNRWYGEYRPYLLHNIEYNNASEILIDGSIPKIPSNIYFDIISRQHEISENTYISQAFSKTSTEHRIFYFRAVLYWVKVLCETPFFQEDGKDAVTGEMKSIYVASDADRYLLSSVLSSTLFFIHYVTWASCQVINSRDFQFPFNAQRVDQGLSNELVSLGKSLQEDYVKNSKVIKRSYSKRGRAFQMEKQYFYIKKSKPIIDNIDKILGQHYGFTEEQLDFIINYDIKYRMGGDDIEFEGE